MTHLIDFYRLQKPDSEGRTLEEIWNWPDEELESCHDFIQWMFPLDEPSAFNPDAPLVTKEDQAAFRADPQLQKAMRRSFSVFLAFLGLTLAQDGSVARAENFNRRISLWKHPNHNWLRITRVLKSLRLLGFDHEARAFWLFLKDLHDKEGFAFANSLEYWKQAMAGLS
jgi:hypothetical protein